MSHFRHAKSGNNSKLTNASYLLDKEHEINNADPQDLTKTEDDLAAINNKQQHRFSKNRAFQSRQAKGNFDTAMRFTV